MVIWHQYPVISAPMLFQMALDELIFRQTENKLHKPQFSRMLSECPAEEVLPILRFYFSSERWMTIGYATPWPKEANNVGNRICRRITGGGVVVHGDDLVFSIIAPYTWDEAFSSVIESYLKIHRAIQNGFKRSGIEARFFRNDEIVDKGQDCFRNPVATDLAFGQDKIAGGAQKRSSRILMHQESIRIPAKRDISDLILNIECGFAEVFEIQLVKIDADPETLRKASKLAETKYRRDYKMIQQTCSVHGRCSSEETVNFEMPIMVGR